MWHNSNNNQQIGYNQTMEATNETPTSNPCNENEITPPEVNLIILENELEANKSLDSLKNPPEVAINNHNDSDDAANTSTTNEAIKVPYAGPTVIEFGAERPRKQRYETRKFFGL